MHIVHRAILHAQLVKRVASVSKHKPRRASKLAKTLHHFLLGHVWVKLCLAPQQGFQPPGVETKHLGAAAAQAASVCSKRQQKATSNDETQGGGRRQESTNSVSIKPTPVTCMTCTLPANLPALGITPVAVVVGRRQNHHAPRATPLASRSLALYNLEHSSVQKRPCATFENSSI